MSFLYNWLQPEQHRAHPDCKLSSRSSSLNLLRAINSYPQYHQNRPPSACMNTLFNRFKKLFSPMGKITEFLSPRSSPRKGQVKPEEEKEKRTSPRKTKADSPKKPARKLRKPRDEASIKTRSSAGSLASSFVLVSSQETFLCETRPTQGPSNANLPPVSESPSREEPAHPSMVPTSRAVSGLRKKSPTRTPMSRAPIQTRSRTAASQHQSAAPAEVASSEDAHDVQRFSYPVEILSVDPVSTQAGSSTAQILDIEGFHTDSMGPSKRQNNDMVIYPDSFPGVKNIKNAWNIFDNFAVPPSAFATPQPFAAPQPVPRVDSPPKKRRLLSRKTNQRIDWFSHPSRPKLETIPESQSSDAETLSENESRLSLSQSSSKRFSASTPPHSHTETVGGFSSPAQSNSTQNSQKATKQDPKLILSKLFQMMEEDSI
ncbi:hypothetical protein PtB15_6B727 [Puccinia triticina]|nr:hypothetical protein PtB15_6B727 [Puccinia triticina]